MRLLFLVCTLGENFWGPKGVFLQGLGIGISFGALIPPLIHVISLFSFEIRT